MSSKPTESALNHEAIPSQQPNAASPLPQVEHEPRSPWRSGWLWLLVVLTALVLLGALLRNGVW